MSVPPTTGAPSETRPLTPVLAEAIAGRVSGIVTATHGKLKRLFCLRRGRLVFATSNLIEEQFDEVLVRSGRIGAVARAHLKAEAKRSGVRPSKLLESGELLTPGEFRVAQREHFEGLLAESLKEPETVATFADGIPNLDAEATADLPCLSAVWIGTAHWPKGLERVRIAIGPPKTSVRLVDDALDRLREDGAPADVVAQAEAFAEPVVVAKWVESCDLDPETAYRRILGLLLCGALERVSEARKREADATAAGRDEIEARLHAAEDGDHYAVLGIDPGAGVDEVRKAYYYLARRVHPDRLRETFPDLLSRIETYFAQVTEAYNTLIDDDARSAYDEERKSKTEAKRRAREQDPTFLARQNFSRAKLMIDKGQRADAVTFLENAIKLDPRNAEYPRELGLLMAGNPRLRTQAEEHIKKAIELDPANSAGYTALGTLYVKMGKPEEARRRFNEALNWDPSDSEALAGLQALGG